MLRLRVALAMGCALVVWGCDQKPICNEAPGPTENWTLPGLLQAHDEEVRQHGKDLCYIKPIGAFGREGVAATLRHVASTGKPVTSYNNVELVLGVAEEARVKTGYDICQDAAALKAMSQMGQDASSDQKRMQSELLNGLCKLPQKTKS